MRLFAGGISGVILLMAILLISGDVLAQEQSRGDQASGVKQESPAAVPELARIIPLSTKLYGRLAVLENAIKGMLDVSEVQKKYDEIDADLKVPAGQLQQIRDSKAFSYKRLVELKQEIERENEVFEEVSKPLNKGIERTGAWRKEWLEEKERWNTWESSLLKEGDLPQLKPTFERANQTIDKALNLVLPTLEAMLAVQEKGGALQKRIKALTAELDGLLLGRKRRFLLDVSPPMFTAQYFSQFGDKLWSEFREGIDEIPWPDRRFFDRYGWIVLLQGFISLVVISAVYRNRQTLRTSKRWGFLAARPFSTGLFVGIMATLFLYRYEGMPTTWELANTVVAGISFGLLFRCLTEVPWKRHFVYGLIGVFIITRIMYVVSLPFPLVRLYVVLTALAGLFFCMRWARESGRLEERFYPGSLRLVSLFFAAIVIIEMWGKTRLPVYVFLSSIHSAALVLVFVLFMHIIRGGVEWLFRASPLRRAAVLNTDDTDTIVRQVARFIYFVMLGLALIPGVLMIWGVYDSLAYATKGVLTLGFTLGPQRISVGLILTSAGILYGSFFISWFFQKALMDKMLVSRRMEKGVRLAIGRLVHYAFIFSGFLLALSVLGIEITKLTIMLSALGVGIGFGLQGVVNNFVSGLILLFERPVRVGDFIEFGGSWSEVRSIGLRATTVQTFDSSDVIIPNADLISNKVTNWTLSNRRRRLDIPVGVAYGSDISLVIKTLMACAGGNTLLVKTPEPQVLFLRFGDSSLDFELRVFVSDVRNSMNVISELHQEIDRRFREAKIEIAFPQRDLHLRGVDKAVMARLPEANEDKLDRAERNGA